MADTDQRAGLEPHPHGHESLLLLARSSDEGAAAYCRDHVTPTTEPGSAWLAVLTERATLGQHDAFARAGRPGAVVAVGESTRSAAESSVPDEHQSTDVEVATGDLGGVGRTVDDYVTSWSGAGHRPVVCVDSLSGLLDHSSIRGTYRFLFVLLRRVEASDGAVHVHADPGVQEEEILRTFFTLFDRVISFQDGGAGPS